MLEEEANDGGVVVEKIGTVYTPSAIASERKDEKLNIITICMFTITTIYLAVEWLIALIGGFGG